MIDFLYSREPAAARDMAVALRRFRADTELRLHEWSGPWGALVTIGPAYPGFEPVETETGVLVVLGGPLPRQDYSVATGASDDDGSRWILGRWIDQGQLVWDDDLVGHFLVFYIDKESGTATAVTDFDSFVPGYFLPGDTAAPMAIGSHVDALATAFGLAREIDVVSVAEFMVHGVVTEPHTFYEGVRQLPFAAASEFARGEKPRTLRYWSWQEVADRLSFGCTAQELRDVVQSNVERICAGQEEINLLMSGGEDSRVISALIPDGIVVHGRTFSDTYNHEAQTARRVAEAMGIEWKHVPRTPAHYAEQASASVRLTESENTILHAHLGGLSDCLVPGVRCIGGLWADALFKALFVQTVDQWGVATRIEIDQPTRVWFGFENDVHVFGQSDVLASVERRREGRRQRMMALRPSSWAEYTAFLPADMTQGYAQVPVARRLAFAYEPYLDARAFKLAARTPASWKINRRLAHKAMKRALQPTWYIPHANGTMPYFGLWLNAPLSLLRRLSRRIVKLLHLPGHGDETGQGPWPEWDEVIASAEFGAAVHAALEGSGGLGEWPELERIGECIMSDDGFRPGWRFAYLQVLSWLSNASHEQGEGRA
ncbi:MAG: asparagine synthase-related protein [Coriobacteriia bacterium]